MVTVEAQEAAAAKAAALDDKTRMQKVEEAARLRQRNSQQQAATRASMGNDLAAARGQVSPNQNLRTAGEALSFPVTPPPHHCNLIFIHVSE